MTFHCNILSLHVINIPSVDMRIALLLFPSASFFLKVIGWQWKSLAGTQLSGTIVAANASDINGEEV
jgi:hypothetical protein